MDILLKYFPKLSEVQQDQFAQLQNLYNEWNEQINVISRKDLENFYVRHLLHALAIAKYKSFEPGNKILDFGTGGGFPGIPLAIMFPEADFHLIDSIGKKIKVVNEISQVIQLNNLVAEHSRGEEISGRYDLVVCRAVKKMDQMKAWTKHLSNRIIALKGGDLKEEIKGLKGKTELIPISKYFQEEFFESKFIVDHQF